MYKLILVVLVLASSTLIAQNENPLLANGYVGYSEFQPHLKYKGFKASNPFQGAEATFGGMTFSFHQGQIREIDADSTVGNPKASIFKVGYRIGKEYSTGSNSFLSMGVKPFFQVSGAVAQIPNKIVNTPVNSAGLVFTPGVQLRFSHVYLTASYDAGLHLNTAFFGGNGKLNLAKGYIGGTTITIGIENGFEVLTPKLFTFKGFNIKKRTYTKDNGVKYDVSRDQYYREIVYTTVTKYSPGSRVLALVKPFWGIGPSYSFKPMGDRNAITSMKGVNAGVRIWYLMLDGYYETGKMGLKDQVGREEILLNYPELRDYDFSSQIPAKSYGARIGFNVSKFFALDVNFKQEESALAAKLGVPFTRLNVFYTIGGTEFLSTPNYTYEGAESRLADYQEKKNITADQTNNPSYLTQKTSFTGYGAGFEIGAAFFNATWYKYKDAPIANHMNYTVGANIPLARVFNSVRARLFL